MSDHGQNRSTDPLGPTFRLSNPPAFEVVTDSTGERRIRRVMLSEEEHAILLRSLLELRVTLDSIDDESASAGALITAIRAEHIQTLVYKLGGDPNDALFGIEEPAN